MSEIRIPAENPINKTKRKISEVETDLRESADIDCVNYTAGERWIRIFLNAQFAERCLTRRTDWSLVW